MDSDADRADHMVFVEFLEFLCRIAFTSDFTYLGEKHTARSAPEMTKKGVSTDSIWLFAPKDRFVTEKFLTHFRFLVQHVVLLY